MRTHVTEQMIDPVIGRRIFTLCWFCAGLGVSILQMLLLAQAWSVSRQALAPTCIVSAWVLGSLVGSRRRTTARLWGGCLLACTLLWFGGTRLVSWRIGIVPTTWLSDGSLIASAMLLGAISTAWLVQQRPWPAVGERVTLARGLIGITAGLCIVWVLPAWAGLIALTCVLPLLVLDCRLSRRSPLPAIGSVVENWVSRYWNLEGFQVQLEVRSLPRNWWWSYLATRAQDTKGYVPLTLLASVSAVILGAIWGAVPTPFAAGLAWTHELGKLGWLLGGQIVALAIGACCALVARNVVGFPDRLVPTSWQARAFALALTMLVILAGSLVTLGLPFLQAPWWLAVSLASYTLAGAIWGFLLPRLRPSFTTLVVAQRHRRLGQGMGLTDPLHLAYGRTQEERLTRLFTTAEGVLIAVFTPVVGLLIDLYGSVDRVLVILGLDRIMMGAERPLVLSEEERRVIAFHESGHTLIAMLTPGADPVHKVTIVPRGRALGATQMMPIDDRHNYPRTYLLARLAVGLGGRAAENLEMGEITTGAENDLQEVTELARQMVTRWGMSSRIGTVFLGGEQEVFLGREVGLRERQSYSEQTAALIDQEVQQVIAERYQYAQDLLSKHQEELERIAQALLEREVLNEQQLEQLVKGMQNNMDVVSDSKTRGDSLVAV